MKVDIECPACHQTITVPVTIKTSEHQPRRDAISLDVIPDWSAVTAHFTTHGPTE